MKTIAIIIAFTLLSHLGYSQDTKGITITVTIDNVKTNKGHVLLGLHSAETFMKGKGIQNAKSEIIDGKIEATFTNVPEGTYAIMAMHDENDNEGMDFETNGMPKESYGMSNNTMSYGPPEFSKAKFEAADKDLLMTIKF